MLIAETDRTPAPSISHPSFARRLKLWAPSVNGLHRQEKGGGKWQFVSQGFFRLFLSPKTNKLNPLLAEVTELLAP